MRLNEFKEVVEVGPFWSLWCGDVEDEKLTSFVSMLLIQMKQQMKGIAVEMFEPGSKEETVWGSYDHNSD